MGLSARKPYTPAMALEIRWTRRTGKLPDEVREELVERIRTVQRHFPEVPCKISVGLTRFYDGLAFQSNDGVVKLMVDVHRTRRGEWKYPTYWTLAHELMHLAQFNSEGIPSGERACDVYALSRMPPELLDDSPSYLVIDKETRDRWGSDLAELAHKLAKDAIKRRAQGLRNYASWWEDEFERMVGSPPNRESESCRISKKLCSQRKRARRDSNP